MHDGIAQVIVSANIRVRVRLTLALCCAILAVHPSGAALGQERPPAERPLERAPSPPRAEQAPADAEETVQLPTVVVIGSTPLPALGIPIEKYAGNVQSIPAKTIENQNLLDMSDTLYRHLGSANILSNQGNPFQNDLTYRGFLASPLTGSPIGLSMYVDGMRFNDGFGDTINWDLLPDSAIASIDVIPGLQSDLRVEHHRGGPRRAHQARLRLSGHQARSVRGLLRPLGRGGRVRRLPWPV